MHGFRDENSCYFDGLISLHSLWYVLVGINGGILLSELYKVDRNPAKKFHISVGGCQISTKTPTKPVMLLVEI